MQAAVNWQVKEGELTRSSTHKAERNDDPHPPAITRGCEQGQPGDFPDLILQRDGVPYLIILVLFTQ